MKPGNPGRPGGRLHPVKAVLLLVWVVVSCSAVGYTVQDIWPRQVEQAINTAGDTLLNWKGKL